MRGLYFLIVGFIITLVSCSKEYTPKPRGYFRIDMPEHNYKKLSTDELSYVFEYPTYTYLQRTNPDQPEWINIVFPYFKAKVHLSYHTVEGDVHSYLEDSRALAYKHILKADGIAENVIVDSVRKVYGMFYIIDGNAASNVQFYLTDSNSHFLRGALYFNARPNKDSLAPVIDFIQQDLQHFVETLEWDQ